MRISDWSSDVCSSDLFAELLGAADGEGLAGEGVDFAFDPQHVVGELARQPRQIVAVDHDPGAFHRLDRRDQRAVDHLVDARATRSEAHTSEPTSLMRILYDVFCLKKKKPNQQTQST